MESQRSFAARLLRLAWPVALARLGIMGMGLVDVIMVGQLAPEQLPHQALGWAPTSVLLVTGVGLLQGVQVLAARAIGEGNPESAGGAWRRGMIVSLLTGALAGLLMWLAGEHVFTAFGISPGLARPATVVMRVLALSVPVHMAYCATAFFLEAIQQPMPSTIVMWLANLVNLGLNFWLVPRYGAVGSAYATFGARLFLAGTLAGYVLLMKEARRYGTRATHGAPAYSELLGIGAAAALSQAAEAGAFSGMTIIAGRIGEQAVAAYQILLNVLAVVFMVALGMASATAVLASEAVGQGQPRAAARASNVGLWLSALGMLLAGLLASGFSQPIGRAYSADLALAALAASLMPLAAATMLPDGIQVVVAAALRARGDNWFPTASHVFAYAAVMPALAFWLAETRGLGVRGLLLAICCASLLSALVLVGRMVALGRRTTRAL